jgi:hypothetical protein
VYDIIKNNEPSKKKQASDGGSYESRIMINSMPSSQEGKGGKKIHPLLLLH